MYYDKQSPEDALACHPDDKLILSEDLSTAESELDEDAKALYHKVLSSMLFISQFIIEKFHDIGIMYSDYKNMLAGRLNSMYQ